MKLLISLTLILLQLSMCWTTIILADQEQPKQLYKTYREDDDPRQEIIHEAYNLWGMEHVLLLECEREWWDIYKKWDGWHAVWLCQVNDRFRNVPKEYYSDWHYQIKYCYKLRQWWTPFYWPTRDVKWQPCYLAAQKYFILK